MKKIYTLIAMALFFQVFSQNSFHDTKGNIDVNAGGQLQFSLPIATPSGIKNVSPNVSLIYISNAGNGIAGYGWSLSGVTSISRSGKTIEKNGELTGIKLDYSDFFSYNGQKLILKSGTYGQPGAEYVTDKYSNIKIKSTGSYSTGGIPPTWQVSGPTQFEVIFEDGSRAWYGNYEPRANNATTPLEYNIIKLKDAQGNVINYEYEQISNVAVIKKISWGGNEDISKPNINEITFNYLSRTLKEQAYVSGAPFVQDKLLNEIIVKTNGSLFKRYVIEYFKNGTNYQFANKITEYNASNEAANPVNFEYPPLTPPSVEEVYLSNSDPFSGVKLTGDVNGDSYLDFIMNNGTVKLGAFNDSFTTISTGKYFNSDALVVTTLLDEEGQVYNGNGIVQYESGKIVGYIFRNNSFVKVYEKLIYDVSDCIYEGGGVGCRITAKLNEADIDGDGITNILLTLDRQDCQWVVPPEDPYLKNNAQKTQNEKDDETIAYRPPPGGTLECYDTHIGDFIIDMKSPILPIINYSKDAGITYANTSNEKFLDFDGDGKIESINVSNTAYTVFEFVKTGPTQYHKKIKFSYSLIENKDPEFPVLFGDFNGDGKLDFTIPVTDYAIGKADNWRFYIGTGTGFSNFLKIEFLTYRKRQTEATGNYNKFAKQYFFSIADMNKDGKSDVVQVFSYNEINWQNTQYRNYGYVISTKIANGTLSDGTLDFTPGLFFSSPQYSVQDIYDLTLFSPLTNPIKSNNNFYNVYVYWKQYLKKLKSPTPLAELSRIKAINQGSVYTGITYTELNPDVNPNFYSKVKKEYYPYFSLHKADQTFAVSQITKGLRKQDFRYRGMTGHLQGRGMIGFVQSARSSWYADGYENTKIWSGVELDTQKNGSPSKEWTVKTNSETQIFPADISADNAQLLSVKLTNYTQQQLTNGVEILLPSNVTEKDFLKNITSVSTINYGNYYLPEFTEININNGFARKTSEMHYLHNVGANDNNYYLGRPDWKEDIVYAYNDSKKTKEAYVYSNNLLESITKYDNANQAWVKDKFTYDEGVKGVGNITKKVSSNSFDAQIITIQDKFDPTGRFTIKKTDNLGQSINFTYNNWGQVLVQTNPFNNTITNTYDNWGKLISSVDNISGTTNYGYEKFSTTPPIGVIGIVGTQITEYLPDGDINIVFTDYFGQKYKTVTKSFNQGYFVAKEVVFDGIGRNLGESEPYLVSSIVPDYSSTYNNSTWNTVIYDDSVYPPKVKAKEFNNGKELETSVSGNTVSIKETNGYSRTTSKTTDALGNVISSTDSGGTITFTYNAVAQNITADYEGNVVSTSYDNWGRKVQFNDPANGIYKYEYTGFGEIKKEISPKGYKQYSYNSSGQLSGITEKSNDGVSTDKQISFNYAIGSTLVLDKTGTANGQGFATTFAYDQNGRVIDVIEYVDNYELENLYTYDNLGRLKTTTKTLGSPNGSSNVKTENVYSSWDGTLYQVKDTTSGIILTELQQVNAKGQTLNAKLGAVQITNTYDTFGFLTREKHIAGANNLMEVSYSFNSIKNELNERHHYNFGINEYFNYDNNNRLISWTNPKTGQLYSNTYDNKGRITFNDQIGTVGFNIGGNPYRASQIILNSQGVFNYDLNGQSKLVQKITYNENNDPIKIDGTLNDYSFQYGLIESRQIIHYGGNFTSNANAKFTKFYSEDGTFEIIKNNTNGQEKHVIYIGGNAYSTSITYIKNYNESTGSYKFLHKDYLGSILAISDEAGNAVERRHFDAWGNFTHLQKNNGGVLTDINAINASDMIVDRGYTSHEYLAGVELIHMNGRLYDPLLRRFLNADENIQDPYNSQNYNKYGYVMNNPLIYSDPSGEFIWVAMAIGGIIGGVQNGLSNMKNGGSFWGGFWKGAIVGAGSAFFALGMPIGILPGFMFGATTGAFFGALSAALNGQNVSSAGLMGGLIGGVVGAVSGGYKAYKAGINVWTGTGTAKQMITVEDLNLSANGDGNFQSTADMTKYYDSNIGNVDGISLDGVKDKIGAKSISLASSDSWLPDGMSVDSNGIMNVDGKQALGVNYGHYKNGFSVGKSSIFIAPAAKSYGVASANLIFKHEFMHAWHWNILPSAQNFNKYSERATSMFTVAYIKAHGLQDNIKGVFHGAYRNLAPSDNNVWHKLFNIVYPTSMSWRKFDLLIPTWIK